MGSIPGRAHSFFLSNCFRLPAFFHSFLSFSNYPPFPPAFLPFSFSYSSFSYSAPIPFLPPHSLLPFFFFCIILFSFFFTFLLHISFFPLFYSPGFFILFPPLSFLLFLLFFVYSFSPFSQFSLYFTSLLNVLKHSN